MITLATPKAWEELTPKQLEFLSRLLLSGVEEAELLTRCLISFSGLKLLQKDPELINGNLYYRFKKIRGRRFDLDTDRFTSMALELEYIVKEIGCINLPDKLGRYTRCDNYLYGITMGEFFMAEAFFAEFTDSKDEEALNKLSALFYRRSWETPLQVEKWASGFRRIPTHKKFVVYLWYTGVKAWMMKKYPYVFSGEATEEVQGPTDSVVMGVISALNNGDITHNQAIKDTEIHEVLFELNKRIETSKSM